MRERVDDMGLLRKTAAVAIIDFETTGRDPLTDYPVSMGVLVVEVSGNSIYSVDSFYSLIRISDPSLVNNTIHVHGITPEMVEKAPLPGEVGTNLVFLKCDNNVTMFAAWNAIFDRRFMGRLFQMCGATLPGFRWAEMQPEEYARLDDYIPHCRCDLVKGLPRHHALADCAQELAVYSDHNGYELDVESLSKQLSRHMLQDEKQKAVTAEA
jgi:DNA polymerase III epsilon subunit-like protein